MDEAYLAAMLIDDPSLKDRFLLRGVNIGVEDDCLPVLVWLKGSGVLSAHAEQRTTRLLVRSVL